MALYTADMQHATAESLRAPAVDRASLSQSEGGWQRAMREAVTDVDTLFDLLDLPEHYREPARRTATGFGLRVPRAYVARMRQGDIHDPLLRQVLPVDAENDTVPGFDIDAVGDHASALGDGVLHKYHGRALLVTTGACAVHCRYCFRRHFDYAAQHAGARQGQTALERIAADTSIREVILSGGDPLSLSNARLAVTGERLDAIAHVERLRIHTRTAVVLPQRVDDAFVDWIAQRKQQCVVVIHANHPQELDADLGARMTALRDAGATLERIAADTSIREVILSGGDPLSLSNARLAVTGERLDAIAHVERLRIHTRTAVVLPQRVDDAFVDWIAQRKQQCVVVIHANHPQELDADLGARMTALRDAGATLLNQAVLLRGVNDDADTLAALSERLFAIGVMPYYLHLLDRVAGTAHFEVAEPVARRLMTALASRLPGYLVPRLARENPGEQAKQVLGHDAAMTA